MSGTAEKCPAETATVSPDGKDRAHKETVYLVLLSRFRPLRLVVKPGMPITSGVRDGNQTFPDFRPECGSVESAKKAARPSFKSAVCVRPHLHVDAMNCHAHALS